MRQFGTSCLFHFWFWDRLQCLRARTFPGFFAVCVSVAVVADNMPCRPVIITYRAYPQALQTEEPVYWGNMLLLRLPLTVRFELHVKILGDHSSLINWETSLFPIIVVYSVESKWRVNCVFYNYLISPLFLPMTCANGS